MLHKTFSDATPATGKIDTIFSRHMLVCQLLVKKKLFQILFNIHQLPTQGHRLKIIKIIDDTQNNALFEKWPNWLNLQVLP